MDYNDIDQRPGSVVPTTERTDMIVIGVDFGTTFSGVSWAYCHAPDDIKIVTSWDTKLNNCSDKDKAPTQLCYDVDNNGEASSWGYSIPPDKDAIKWFKLCLLDEKDVPSEVLNSEKFAAAKEMLLGIGKTSSEVISNFLRNIWNHAIDSISAEIGTQLLMMCKLHVIITIPAIWPAYAQQRMKEAAQKSGILAVRAAGVTTLCFISEPEAAALATLKDLSKRSTTKNGDIMIVCDCGGGTVVKDLISYEVETMNPFSVKECVPGSGGLCGGVFLDEAFLELIKQKIGHDDWQNVSPAAEKKFLNDEWEHGIKPQLQTQAREWLVGLPDGCEVVGKDGKRAKTLVLSTDDLFKACLPIFKKIEALIREQADAVLTRCEKKPKGIVLVGGFGRSRLLYHRVKELAQDYGATVLQSRGSEPWSAICRGAVIQGLTMYKLSPNLSISVGARKARASYGIRNNSVFDERKHDETDRFFCEDYQRDMAKNQVKWFLKYGEDINDRHPARFPLYRLIKGDRYPQTSEIHISTAAATPKKCDETVQKLCTVTWNQSVDTSKLPNWTNSLGKVFKVLSFHIQMSCEQGTLDFVVLHRGQRIGGKSVKVQFE